MYPSNAQIGTQEKDQSFQCGVFFWLEIHLTGIICLFMSLHDNTIADPRSNGVVAVICEDRQFLVIKRGPNVIAPGKICFPGGKAEPGESEKSAVIRELDEELGVAGEVIRLVWRSMAPWQVALSWWHVKLETGSRWQPNPDEVAWVGWMGPQELTQSPDLLESNRHFLEALDRGEILSVLDG